MATPPRTISQTPFPNLQSPLVDEFGNISQPWYRLLIALWKKTGGSSSVVDSVYLTLDPTDSDLLDVYNTSTGELVGSVSLTNTGQPAEPIAIGGVSPFVYRATRNGTLVVFSSQVELNRHDTDWHTVSLQGGAIPMLKTDQARMTWFLPDPPILTFFPN